MNKKFGVLVIGILAVAIVSTTGSYLFKETTNVAQASSGLEIEDWRWKNTSFPRGIKINGVVTNNSNRTYEHIEIFISAYDDNGNFLGAGWAYLQPRTTLLPGQSSTFTVYIDDAACPTRYLEIKYQFYD